MLPFTYHMYFLIFVMTMLKRSLTIYQQYCQQLHFLAVSSVISLKTYLSCVEMEKRKKKYYKIDKIECILKLPSMHFGQVKQTWKHTFQIQMTEMSL
jgi:hypothetical protein